MTNLNTWHPLLKCEAYPPKPAIYVIKNISNGLEYVGKTSNLSRRLTVHRCGKTANSRLHRAIAKHGKGMFEVSYILTPLDQLNTLEVGLVKDRNTLSPHGYNLTEGGEGTSGWNHRQETREKIGRANRGRLHSETTKARLKALQASKQLTRPSFKHSETTKQRLKELRQLREPITEVTRYRLVESHKGKPMLAITRKALAKANIGRTMSETVKSALLAATLGTSRTDETKAKIGEALRGRPLSEATKLKMVEAISLRNNPNLTSYIYVWEKEGLLPKVFDSFEAASRYLGITVKKLRGWCRVGAPKWVNLTITWVYL